MIARRGFLAFLGVTAVAPSVIKQLPLDKALGAASAVANDGIVLVSEQTMLSDYTLGWTVRQLWRCGDRYAYCAFTVVRLDNMEVMNIAREETRRHVIRFFNKGEVIDV